MSGLSETGRQLVEDIARRHGVSSEAAGLLLSALAAGGGRQAQFNHPDLGGMGQWTQGGMIMIGDMFNQSLKARVAALCDDLAQALRDHPELDQTAAPSSGRWPADLGSPSATGSQNDFHYAVFPGSRRLAIERAGHVTIYDTGDHRIGGVSQAQAGDQSLRFTSQSGAVDLADLKVVGEGAPTTAGEKRADPAQEPLPEPPAMAAPGSSPHNPRPPVVAGDGDIISMIERLADLRSRDIITAEEFAAKKAELLARL